MIDFGFLFEFSLSQESENQIGYQLPGLNVCPFIKVRTFYFKPN